MCRVPAPLPALPSPAQPCCLAAWLSANSPCSGSELACGGSDAAYHSARGGMHHLWRACLEAKCAALKVSASLIQIAHGRGSALLQVRPVGVVMPANARAGAPGDEARELDEEAQRQRQRCLHRGPHRLACSHLPGREQGDWRRALAEQQQWATACVMCSPCTEQPVRQRAGGAGRGGGGGSPWAQGGETAPSRGRLRRPRLPGSPQFLSP